MYYKHNAFENQIFDSYRQKAKAITDAIELLKEHNYRIIDLEDNWIQKEKTKYKDE